jgi:ATP-dependent DNA helicase RecG
VASAFFHAGEIEVWGRGVQRIMDACKEAGTPSPTVTYDPSDLWFEFPYSPEYLKILSGMGEAAEKQATETSVKTREKAREKTREKILAMACGSAKKSTDEMAVELGITRKGIEWHIRKLKTEGILRRIGPD